MFQLDPAALANVETPIIVHYNEDIGFWAAEPTTVDLEAGTATATLDSFSFLDVLDAITFTAGSITGNRAGSGPTDCGTPPDWVDGILAYNGRNDPLRTCLSTSANGELEVHVVNNRGYPVTLTLGEGNPRIYPDPAVPGDAVSMLSVALAQRNGAATVVQSGAQVHLVYDRPAPGQVVNVHIKARTDALSYWTSAMGTALSGFVANGIRSDDPRIQAWNRIRKQISNAQGQTDCMLTVVSETAVPPQDAAAGVHALRTCSDQFQEVMRQEGVDGRLIGAFSKTIKALAIVDTGYKLIDRAADPVNGAGFDVDLRGTRASEAIAAEQTGPGEYTLRFDHPTWGRVRLVTQEVLDRAGYPAGQSTLNVFDSSGNVRYSEQYDWLFRLRPAGTSEPEDWLRHPPVNAAIDATGNIFIDWDPGRYNGVTVLRPNSSGFEDFGTSLKGQDSPFYSAYVVDIDNDATFEIEKYTNDCLPSCVDGTTTSEIYRWTGSGFAP